jgi:diketogulonate reductase-like aldo/keto reductase
MKMMTTSSRHLILRNNSDIKALDVVLLHSPSCWSGHCTAEEETHDWRRGWRNLETLKDSGLVLNIGVSNFNVELLRELSSFANSKVAVVQNWMDPFNQDNEVREYCAGNGIAYMAYSSFGTQWEGKLKRNPVFTSPVLTSIASKHNTTVAQVVLSWVLQEGAVAIPRASKAVHVRENLTPLNRAEGNGVQVFLQEDDMTTIRSLDGSLGSLW